MNLTREQAIAEHRKMWNWIADETLRQKRVVGKKEYFDTFQNTYKERPMYNCWACEFSPKNSGTSCGNRCIIDWKCHSCGSAGSAYSNWLELAESDNYIEIAEAARKIAELPERGI